jgi:hypothetical protein
MRAHTRALRVSQIPQSAERHESCGLLQVVEAAHAGHAGGLGFVPS